MQVEAGGLRLRLRRPTLDTRILEGALQGETQRRLLCGTRRAPLVEVCRLHIMAFPSDYERV